MGYACAYVQEQALFLYLLRNLADRHVERRML